MVWRYSFIWRTATSRLYIVIPNGIPATSANWDERMPPILIKSNEPDRNMNKYPTIRYFSLALR
jgi:hypothetical protein